MKDLELLEEFALNQVTQDSDIIGGDHRPTYIGLHGDIYDSSTKAIVFFDEFPPGW